jgi:hypothetical protein
MNEYVENTIAVGAKVWLKGQNDRFDTHMTVTEIEYDQLETVDAEGKPTLVNGDPKGAFIAWFNNQAELKFARLPLNAITTECVE